MGVVLLKLCIDATQIKLERSLLVRSQILRPFGHMLSADHMYSRP